MAHVAPKDCPECKSENISLLNEGLFQRIYKCWSCRFIWSSWPIPRKGFKVMNFVVIRDDNNRILTSIEQAIHVAEKLAAENPSHKYYIAKLIKESKASNVITTDIE